ncbi:MAG: hypothetical protein EBU83_01895 [bacterium]|nr:hypothetical protein [Candidatus Aquidulcis sp.]
MKWLANASASARVAKVWAGWFVLLLKTTNGLAKLPAQDGVLALASATDIMVKVIVVVCRGCMLSVAYRQEDYSCSRFQALRSLRLLTFLVVKATEGRPPVLRTEARTWAKVTLFFIRGLERNPLRLSTREFITTGLTNCNQSPQTFRLQYATACASMSAHKQHALMSETKMHIEQVHAFVKQTLAKVQSLIVAHQNVMATLTDKESQFALDVRANYERLLDEEEELLRIIGKIAA